MVSLHSQGIKAVFSAFLVAPEGTQQQSLIQPDLRKALPCVKVFATYHQPPPGRQLTDSILTPKP